MGDDRFDLLLAKQVKKGNQIVSKQFGFQPLEGLDTLRDYPLSARQKPATRNIQCERGGSPKASTAAGAA